ncbi:hypothetical protein Y017_03860 [Alcanivorax sp. 97CO-5]|nr:hypothetical protein Y017_03860 [Alcanivorax sp. 97CO-5]
MKGLLTFKCSEKIRGEWAGKVTVGAGLRFKFEIVTFKVRFSPWRL